MKSWKKKGHGEIAVLPPQDNYKEYRIGVLDESQFSFIEKLEQMSGMDQLKCRRCGKLENENRFYKCRNCGFLECNDCGFQRLYNNQIPVIHECGKDDFEFLGNIGKCANCGEPLGFRSIPQSLRVRMIGNVPVGRMQLLSAGILGYFSAEKQFIDKEISLVFKTTQNLIAKLGQNRSNPEIWIQLYRSITSNLLRLEWSSDYILQVLDMFLNMLKVPMYPNISQKLQIAHSEFLFLAILHSRIFAMIRDQISKEDYDLYLAEIYSFMNNKGAQLYSQAAKNSVATLKDWSIRIIEPKSFNIFISCIESLFFTTNLETVMNGYPDQLKCSLDQGMESKETESNDIAFTTCPKCLKGKLCPGVNTTFSLGDSKSSSGKIFICDNCYAQFSR